MCGVTLWDAARAVLLVTWVVYFLPFAVRFFRLRRERLAAGHAAVPRISSRASDLGLLVESIGVLVAWAFRRAQPAVPAYVLILALVLLAASVAFGWAALWRLGRHFRIRAVVTQDHELVQTGPYAVVRHPIFASVLGMLAATVATVSQWPAGIAAVAIFLAGTEIRLRAEEKLMERRFGEEFRSYKRRVAAYLPLLR